MQENTLPNRFYYTITPPHLSMGGESRSTAVLNGETAKSKNRALDIPRPVC